MTTDENDLHAELVMERVAHFSPTLWNPVLLRLARRNHDRRNWPTDRRGELSLPFALFRPRTEVPFNWLGRNSERGEKLEVLILNVLDGVRRNLSVGKEPVQVARTSAIEAELDWSVRRGGHDPRLEIDLEI